jgi:hypothetical protein
MAGAFVSPGGKDRAIASGTRHSAAVTHSDHGRGTLAGWAQASGRARESVQAGGCLRFVFYGRVSTEDWQDPVTSRARQRAQADVLVRGHGRVVAEFFDAGESRMVAWTRRPARPTGTGWPTPDPIRIKHTLHGAAARTAWTPTRTPRMWSHGCSRSGWPGTP